MLDVKDATHVTPPTMHIGNPADFAAVYGRSIACGQSDFERFRDFICQQTGIYYPQDKRYRLENRIKRRMRERGMEQCDEYYRLLRYNDGAHKELTELFSEVTVNETSFLRNPGHFHALENVVVPDFQEERRIAGPLRVWSAACSTGQEPYSLAITLDRMRLSGSCRLPVEIKATDISPRVLDIARKGVYAKRQLENVAADIRDVYFETDADTARVSAGIRNMVRFGYLNLNDPFPGGSFEVVFIRNVLMYFREDQKRRVLDKVSRALVPGGYLFLGDTETLQGMQDGFTRLKTDKSIYYRKAA